MTDSKRGAKIICYLKEEYQEIKLDTKFIGYLKENPFIYWLTDSKHGTLIICYLKEEYQEIKLDTKFICYLKENPSYLA